MTTTTEDTWTTKDKKVIPVKDITDDHLKNIMHFLKRAAMARHAMSVSNLLCAAGTDVTDSVADAIHMELEQLASSTWRDHVHPSFEKLQRECDRRKLRWDFSTERDDLVLQTKLDLAIALK